MRESLQDTPERVQDFVSLLHEFEQVGEGPEVTSLFRKLRSILGEETELLRDFAAFLHPEQALQCGLVKRGCVCVCVCVHVWLVLLLSPVAPDANVDSYSWRSSRPLNEAAASSASWRSLSEKTRPTTRRSSRPFRPDPTSVPPASRRLGRTRAGDDNGDTS